MLRITTYQPKNRDTWNAFVAGSANGTFLFNRNFMDYHANRFKDASLMVYDGDEVVTCIPAHKTADIFYSHQGLTYGGFIWKEQESRPEEIIKSTITYLKQADFKKAVFNIQLPFYDKQNARVKACLIAHGFEITRELCNMHAHLTTHVAIANKKKTGYRNGKFDALKLRVSSDFESFWEQVLVPQLAARHNAKPVHTVEEIKLLASHFPQGIKQYNVYKNEVLLAGVTFFLHNGIAKSQYAATSPAGMKCSAMDYLYIEATQDFKDQGYLIMDYGPVNERDGSINRGVQRFKEELGCMPLTSLQFTKTL